MNWDGEGGKTLKGEMTCSPDLVPKCHIPWGQAWKLKHCCPNNLSPPYFSLLNCRHLLEFCHSADHTKKGFFLKQKQFLSYPKLLHENITKHPVLNVLYPKTNWPKRQISIFCTRLTLADGYAVYLWHLLGNPWAGITFPPKEVTTDASGCICVSKWD